MTGRIRNQWNPDPHPWFKPVKSLSRDSYCIFLDSWIQIRNFKIRIHLTHLNHEIVDIVLEVVYPGSHVVDSTINQSIKLILLYDESLFQIDS